MDRGRQIDNIQNCNAVFIDRFGKSGKTSTRVLNPPGGKDHFSLGWDEPPKELQRQHPQQYSKQPDPYEVNKPRIDRRRNEQELPRNIPQHGYNNKPAQNQQQYQQQQHTSVRVNQRPGGNSNIIFGSDDSNYDHYRK